MISLSLFVSTNYALDDLAVSHYLTYFKLNSTNLFVVLSLFLHAEGCQGKYKQNLSIIMKLELVAAHNIKQTGLLRVASQQHIILIITIAWYREN